MMRLHDAAAALTAADDWCANSTPARDTCPARDGGIPDIRRHSKCNHRVKLKPIVTVSTNRSGRPFSNNGAAAGGGGRGGGRRNRSVARGPLRRPMTRERVELQGSMQSNT